MGSKTEYEKVKSKREIIIKEINALYGENPVIQKYIELLDENQRLLNDQKELYKSMKFEEYSKCNHIFVTVSRERDYREARNYYYEGCIKCGLDQTVFYIAETFDIEELNESQRIMYDYMYGGAGQDGIHTNIRCNLELAKAIYLKIKENHPNTSDKNMVNYFKHALSSIRENEVSDERKENRAKRLSLSPKFNNWNGLYRR